MISKEKYSQPSFYHFAESSIQLSNFAYEKNKEAQFACDVFAGCGIVGRTYYEKNPNLKSLYFIELQNEFETHWKENCSSLKNIKFLQGDFRDFSDHKYDLIMANPPFFSEKSKRTPFNEKKKHCKIRGFEWSDFSSWVKGQMQEMGDLFVLIPLDEDENFKEKMNLMLIESRKLNAKECLVHMRLNIK